jgi:plasmid replication initiation protein
MDKNNTLVIKSNALIEASYRLGIQEQRILLACITQIRTDELITDQKLYTVRAEELAEIYNIDKNSAYRELKKSVLKFKRREVWIEKSPNGEGGRKKTLVTNWLQSIEYDDGNGCVNVRFSHDIIPYVNNLSKEFTKYALSDIAKISSAHAIRMFELLMQWEKIGQREIYLEDFKEKLRVEDKHKRFTDLKRYVIQPAIEQINQNSPFKVTWKKIKNGKKVTKLSFTFSRKKSELLPSKSKKIMTKKEMEKEALPGESWVELKKRLNSKAPV